MRNLKKILALVLALVMSMSLMATANAFTDDASIEADYETATKVLAGMGIFQGYPDGSFGPKAAITRQEVAAIMYRIASKDVTDLQDALYVEGADFDDVKATDWSAGYIGYCANGGIVGGYGNGKFGPQDQVTGYQVLAMALRAIGYDKNGEFTGAEWQKNVATTAQSLGILKNVPGTVQLSQPATRELVAELVFQTMTVAKMANYTPAFGYQPTTKTLGEVQFGLKATAGADKWGRPTTVYSYTTAGKAGTTTITAKPIATYNTAVTECDVAHAAKLTADKTYTLYVNGAVKSNLPVQVLDTVDTLGAQGRITEVYKDTIVMIDTFLAKVTATADAKYDKNGHQVAPYSITMTVYDDATGHTVVLTDKDAAFGYAAGDMVLVNAYTATGDRDVAGLVSTGTGNVAIYGEIIGLAKSEVGAQSVIWYNAAKHTVNGNTYNDACEFNKNDATTTTVNYTWYFDQFGNLIGAFQIDTQYDYAVLTKIWWAGDPATGLGKAMGTLKYMDGSENTVEIAKIDGKTTTYAVNANFGVVGTKFEVATYATTNATIDGTYGWIDGNLLRVYTNAKGAVELELVKDSTGSYHTEITATIANKYTYIGGLKVDTATKFLVGTANASGVYSYTTYTGINEIPSFTAANAIVDYVLGTNDVVKYAYVIGTPDSASTTDHVLVTNTGYTATLKTAGGVDYYEVNLYTMEGLVTRT